MNTSPFNGCNEEVSERYCSRNSSNCTYLKRQAQTGDRNTLIDQVNEGKSGKDYVSEYSCKYQYNIKYTLL